MSNTLNRAQFLKAAGIAGAASLVASVPALASDATEPAWDLEADVVICGCGTSGTAAAIEAADAGAEVVVIEKMDWLGGQMRRCGGGVAAAGSQVQKALGVEDDADSFYDYWVARAEGFCDPELVRVTVDNAAALVDWIIDDLGGQPVDQWAFSDDIEGGLEYSVQPGLNIGTNPDDYAAVEMEPVARCHWFAQNPDDPILEDDVVPTFPTHGGTGLWKTLGGALSDRGVEPLTQTALVSLVTNADGEVVGVVADQNGTELRIKARKGVIVATGNFASNAEMMKNYGLVDIEGINFMDIEGQNDGSGIKAVLAVGGDLMFPGLLPGAEKTSSYMVNGLKIDTSARAIDVYGNPIPRLYVASVAAGGFMGNNYPCCGASVTRNLVFGRIAGQQAAALESWA